MNGFLGVAEDPKKDLVADGKMRLESLLESIGGERLWIGEAGNFLERPSSCSGLTMADDEPRWNIIMYRKWNSIQNKNQNKYNKTKWKITVINIYTGLKLIK